MNDVNGRLKPAGRVATGLGIVTQYLPIIDASAAASQ